MSASRTGLKRDPAAIAKTAAANKGRVKSEATIILLRAARARQIITPEMIAKTAAANRGRKQRPETITKRADKLRGQKRSAEQCAALSLAHKNLPPRVYPPETKLAFVDKAISKMLSFEGNPERAPGIRTSGKIWAAHIKDRGAYLHIGTYGTADDAFAARLYFLQCKRKAITVAAHDSIQPPEEPELEAAE